MLWVDKHRPKNLDSLTYQPETTSRLRALAAQPASVPHLLFYGPSGCGKKTRVKAFLRSLYGPGVEKLRLDQRVFTTPTTTKKTIEVHMVVSNYHIELSPGDAGLNDRFVIQDVIKEIASHKNIVSEIGKVNANAASSSSSKASASASSAPGFKTVVLVDVDRLSRQAQAALRRTMEKYTSTCRLILVCNSPSKVLDPVRSRCLGVRVSAPTIDDIVDALMSVSRQESFTLPEELAVNIARESSRNLRRALLMLEACTVHNRNALKPDTIVQKTDWELYIRQLAQDITHEQSPQRLLSAREQLYELLVSCIPASIILKTLVQELTRNLDDTLKIQIFEVAAFYEHRMALGSKEIFHLEAFIAKYMAIYKKFLNELFQED